MSDASDVSRVEHAPQSEDLIAQRIRDYRPRAAMREWPEIEDTVRQLVTDWGPPTAPLALEGMRALTAFLGWAIRDAGMELEPRSLFHGAFIKQFATSARKNQVAKSTWEREMNVVGRIGEIVRGERTVLTHITDSEPAVYSPSDLIEMLYDERSRSGARQRHSSLALLASCAGAGIRASELDRLTVGHIQDGQIVVADRTVPILGRWHDVLLEVTERLVADDYVLAPWNRGQRMKVAHRVVHRLREAKPRTGSYRRPSRSERHGSSAG